MAERRRRDRAQPRALCRRRRAQLEHAHNNIRSDNRKSQLPSTLERNVRMFCDMRLRDHVLGRGRQAKKDKDKEVKDYPLHKGDWSSCDE